MANTSKVKDVAELVGAEAQTMANSEESAFMKPGKIISQEPTRNSKDGAIKLYRKCVLCWISNNFDSKTLLIS